MTAAVACTFSHTLSSKSIMNYLSATFPLQQAIRRMERVSAQRCCILYTDIERVDCNCNDLELGPVGSRSSKFKGHGANRKPIGGLLLCVQHRIYQ